MAHTLRRSKSKYGRTRCQRRKHKRTQGGGFFDEFVNKFKPSPPEEKCEKAKKDAEEACSSISQSQETSSLPQSELDSGFPESPSVMSDSVSGSSTMTEPLEPLPEPAIASELNVMPNSESVVPASWASAPSALIQQQPMIQGNESVLPLESQMQSTMPVSDSVTPLTPNAVASASPNQTYKGSGGTKSKRKNKKQNRRKKMKSRKHKK